MVLAHLDGSHRVDGIEKKRRICVNGGAYAAPDIKAKNNLIRP
jgi:hypothetical protein